MLIAQILPIGTYITSILNYLHHIRPYESPSNTVVDMSLAHHTTLRRAAPAFSSTTTRSNVTRCFCAQQHARSQPVQQHEQQQVQQQQSRRALLSQSAAAAAGLMLLQAPSAYAVGPLDNIARQLTRPEITPLEVRQQQGGSTAVLQYRQQASKLTVSVQTQHSGGPATHLFTTLLGFKATLTKQLLSSMRAPSRRTLLRAVAATALQ
jgi:hypothetical protein